ncbi:AraC family transcriptional regulator [Aquincola sp. S2]|uniref:AraC family transcriptional regulator n=1 Tax=Pseudaquabacterium terrae TaxID=2732868 RepID=A0ABX2EES4_9BURK|nr:AraC family transcriptional regulator [Aquabacterium terrae]
MPGGIRERCRVAVADHPSDSVTDRPATPAAAARRRGNGRPAAARSSGCAAHRRATRAARRRLRRQSGAPAGSTSGRGRWRAPRLPDVRCQRSGETDGAPPWHLRPMVCAAVRFEHPAARHLVSLLPPQIVIDAADVPDADWLHGTLRLMAAEARQPRPGGETVITRLADILVIQAIRGWIAQAPQAQTGWLGALQDRQIGRAITLIQREPARDWTLESLAAAVAMSRSAFAARFTERVGMPAMQYLTQWRMQLAQSWLQAPGALLADVAERAGYRSEAAFSRAFKRHAGIAPGAARGAQARAAGAEIR